MAVNPLTAIVRLFVNTFGITQPSPENEQRAGRVILAMLVGVVLMLAVVGWALRTALLR
jgi:ABC-type amino acid transport system permease subunit